MLCAHGMSILKDIHNLFSMEKMNGLFTVVLYLIYLDVVCVGRLEFFSEVRVCFQHLNHLSEVTVIV